MSRRVLLVLLGPLAAGVLLALPALAQAPLGPPSATPIAQPPDTPSGDGTGVRLSTEQGAIVIGLFTESSPVAAENFLNLVRAGFYDGLTFHRLVPGFVIQGGDPDGDGSGGPGYTIADEPVVGRYGRGIVAMARTQAPDSQGSQFFIVLDDAARRALASANTYAIFGRVLEGMDVVDAIAAMPNSGGDENRALDPVTITRATVEQVVLPPEPSAPPSGDAELEAMLPPTLGGQPLQLQSVTGAELLDQFGADDPGLAELQATFATLGATMADFSIASGGVSTGDASAGVTAFRLKGADASRIIGPVVGLFVGMGDLQQSASELAGRAVIVLTDGPDGPDAQRLYAVVAGDVLFLVGGMEPLLSEAIGALP